MRSTDPHLLQGKVEQAPQHGGDTALLRLYVSQCTITSGCLATWRRSATLLWRNFLSLPSRFR